MKIGKSWIWLLVICLANVILGAYYFYDSQMMLGFVYIGFGAVWGVLSYSAYNKKQKS